MNYHIITQEKFFNTYIEDIYRLGLQDENVIWVRGKEGKSDFFRTDRPVEFLGNDGRHFVEKLRELKPDDRLFVSWYDTKIGNAILRSGIKNPVYVYLMGAEFYTFPYWWHAEWLFDPITRRKVKRTRLYPRFFPKGKPWLWYRCKNWWKFKREVRAEYEAQLRTIKRIDYIVITEHSGPEVELVKRLYPGCRAKHVIGTFDQNFDIAKSQPLAPIPEAGTPLKILMGNSSDPNGNHLDAFRYLKKKVKGPYELYTFLSYGDPEAKEWALACGKKLFGETFHPVLDFMDKNAFVKFMNGMDVVMMFHNRQQAEGNIMTALALGKPVFMKPMNPQYDMLKRMGVKSVYDVREMHRVDLREAIVLAQAHRAETMAAIEAEYSDAARQAHLRVLLTGE